MKRALLPAAFTFAAFWAAISFAAYREPVLWSQITGSPVGTAGALFIDQGAGTSPLFEALSGDATITSAGVMTIANGAVTTGKVAAHTLVYSNITQATQNTLLGNNTGSPADLRNVSVPNCTVAALQWTAGTGFSCPASFPSSLITGTTTNDSAAAGFIGEYISADVPSTSPVSLTTATPANVTSVSLTAGDWGCNGVVITKPAGSTTTSLFQAWMSTTSAAVPTNLEPGSAWASVPVPLATAGGVNNINFGPSRFSLSGTTTVYLSTQVSFATSTMGAYGFIGCRRAR